MMYVCQAKGKSSVQESSLPRHKHIASCIQLMSSGPRGEKHQTSVKGHRFWFSPACLLPGK